MSVYQSNEIGDRTDHDHLDQEQVIAVAIFDLASQNLSLVTGGVTSGAWAWDVLREVAKRRETDNESCSRFLLWAVAFDPHTGEHLHRQHWHYLGHDQVSRVEQYVASLPDVLKDATSHPEPI